MVVKTNFVAVLALLYFEIGLCSIRSCTNSLCQMNEDSLRFFVLGDWGGIPVWPYQSLAQSVIWCHCDNYRVAKGMGEMGETRRSHFQISVGDNFYTHGVKDAFDQRFQDTFEKVYKKESLRTPWYIVGGNHDHYGNITGQIAYSKRSSRWVFPNPFYSARYELSDETKVDLVMIDTVVLCGNLKSIRNANLMTYLSSPDSTEQPVLQTADRSAAEDHWSWLEEQFRSSRADYLFVAGHFPVYSVGEHGSTSCLVERLLPLLTANQVSAYLSGHDHDLQHLEYRTNGRRLHFVVSGTGGFIDSSRRHYNSVPSGSLKFHYPQSGGSNYFSKFFNKGGFVYATVNRNNAAFSYFKGDKTLLHQFVLYPRI